MVVGLSTGQELGIVAVAAVFIAFAVAVSFLVPTRDRDFPGRRLKWFLLVVVLLFAAMMSAIVLLAREPEEDEGHDGEAAAAPAEAGDAAAGEAVFASAACGNCHTLAAAGSSGTVGPSLDTSAVTFEQAVEQVRSGGGAMPAFEGQLSDEEIRDVAAFVVEARD